MQHLRVYIIDRHVNVQYISIVSNDQLIAILMPSVPSHRNHNASLILTQVMNRPHTGNVFTNGSVRHLALMK